MITETKDGFKLLGLSLVRSTSNQDNQSSKDCGDLWQKFEADRIFDCIPGKLSEEVYAVYFDYIKETLTFSYFIGCRVEHATEAPTGLEELLVPAQAYQRFLATGIMTGCITAAWETVWGSAINRKFAYDFEVYGKKSRNWNDAEVDIFISVME